MRQSILYLEQKTTSNWGEDGGSISDRGKSLQIGTRKYIGENTGVCKIVKYTDRVIWIHESIFPLTN